MRHTIAILLENEAGALSRVAGLFSARGYNIESLTVAPTDEVSVSRLTLVTTGNDEIVEQITKQLNKLVDVIKLVELDSTEDIERELLLARVKAGSAGQRSEVKRLVDIFRGRILDVYEGGYIVELTGRGSKIDAFLEALETAQIGEVVRSGVTGIARGPKGLRI
ncbi:MAG: acetolactate synthase small subunit [Gammaproteobacteria bacterium]|nr:acetolactate synthase small subunit [Gammaproteobacteria bacterium]